MGGGKRKNAVSCISQPSRSWVFTLAQPRKQERTFLKSIDCARIVVGLEVAPSTGTLHLQGFITFLRAYRLTQLKKLLPRAHWERAKCADAANYCLKERIWLNKDNRSPGQRKDIEEAYRALETGTPRREFLSTRPSFAAVRLYTTLAADYAVPRDFKPTVIWLWGPTGSGKSHTACSLCDDYCVVSLRDRYWFGYGGQRCVVIDELRATDCPFSALLRFTDRWPCTVPTFYGWQQLRSRLMVITSCQPPADTFRASATEEDLDQLERRITYVIELTPGTSDRGCSTSDALGSPTL